VPARPLPPLQWDLFCRVVDNFGDVGVCWRLACELQARGARVRLWIDDASALAWMAPKAADTGVAVLDWSVAEAIAESPLAQPGDVVVEAFGCTPPAAFVRRMVRPSPPVWINLEYLSAEDYVERSHGLPSPQLAGTGAGLTKWFVYPGFTRRTGGLLREEDLLQRQAQFDAAAWLAARGWTCQAHEWRVLLFGYATAPWKALLAALAGQPCCLFVTAGPLQAALASVELPPGVRVCALPLLTQIDFDHLLWSCELNLVRGEDSLVRALWAGRPLLWQLYPQEDGAHEAKLSAFARWYGATAMPGLGEALARWNGLSDGPLRLPEPASWLEHATRVRHQALELPDLVMSLQQRVDRSRNAAG
jgi:uncharacterized repeat protein (TIGR03837 family)